MLSGHSPIAKNAAESARSSGAEAEILTDYPSIRDKVAVSLESGVVRVLLTDIDATFVLGAGHTESEIAEGQRVMRDLVGKLNGENVIIIPISGSHFDSGTQTTNSILNRIEQGVLPLVGPGDDRSYRVDAYVSDGGARAVRGVRDREVGYDQRYQSTVHPEAYDYQGLSARALALAAQIAEKPLTEDEIAIIARYDRHAQPVRIHMQPGTEDGTHRNSNKFAFYFYASTLEERDAIEQQFLKLGAELGVRAVCCEEKDANTQARRHPDFVGKVQEGFPLKYCLDIVPFDKGSAVRYFTDLISAEVAEQCAANGSTSRPRIEVWACGDSGNDYALMAPEAVTNVVIVGGASQELIRLGERLSEMGKQVYIESDPNRIGPASIANAFFGA